MDAFFNSEAHNESFSEASSFEPDAVLSLGPEEYLEHLRLVKQRRPHPGDGIAERCDARWVDVLCEAARRSRRRRARAAHLSRGQRHVA